MLLARTNDHSTSIDGTLVCLLAFISIPRVGLLAREKSKKEGRKEASLRSVSSYNSATRGEREVLKA